MKTNIQPTISGISLAILIFLGLPFGLISIEAENTNRITERFHTRFFPEWSAYSPHAEIDFMRNRLIAGELVPEVLPATEDTNGNWGMPIDGLQLSLRLRQHEYLIGEPVTAIVIIRNVGPEERRSYVEHNPDDNFDYTLTCGTQTLKWQKAAKKNNALMSDQDFTASSWVIASKSQTVVPVRIDKIFELREPGEYLLQVERRERLSSSVNFTNLVSGKALFRIVKQLSPSEVEATNVLYEHQLQLQRKIESIRTQPGAPLSAPKGGTQEGVEKRSETNGP